MQKGLAIIESTDTETRGYFIEEEILELEMLNARSDKRIAEEAEQREADHHRKMADKAAARRKAYKNESIKYIVLRLAVLGGVVWAGTAGMIHPAIYIPVALFCLCTACLRIGEWFGRGCKK